MAGDISISTPSFVNKEELLLQLGVASLAGLMLKSAELYNNFFSKLSKERKAAALGDMFKALSEINMQTQGEEVKKAMNIIASAAQVQAMDNALLGMRNVVERTQSAAALGEMFKALSEINIQTQGEKINKAMNVFAQAAQVQSMSNALLGMRNVVERTQAVTALAHAAKIAKYAIEQTKAQASAIGDMFKYMATVLERSKVAVILGNLASVAANAIVTASATAASTLTKVSSSTLSSNLPNAKEAAKAAASGSNLWIFLALVAMNLMEDNEEENDKKVEHPDSAIAQEEQTSSTCLDEEPQTENAKSLTECVSVRELEQDLPTNTNKPLLPGFNAATLEGSFGVSEQPLLKAQTSENKRLPAPAA